MYEPISEELEAIGAQVVDAAFTVHKNLGPGLLEKIYETCFCYELAKRGLKFEQQKQVSIFYDGIYFEEGLRIDVLVENQIICELKAVETMNDLWKAQVISYLKLTNNRLGYLINFNSTLLKHGLQRIVI